MASNSSSLGSRLRTYWLACLFMPAAILVFIHLTNDYRSEMKFGWDVAVNCAAVEAHTRGLDPYYVRNLGDTKLSYPYLPVTLEMFRPFCADGLLERQYRSVYLVIAALSALLCSLAMAQRSGADVALRILLVFGGFSGFEWALVTGNFAIMTGLLTALGLWLFRYGLARQESSRDAGSFLWYAAGAASFGLLTSLKVVCFPVLMALYFLPLSRRRRIGMIVIAVGWFVAPVLISFLLYHDLFLSWIAAITGQIPGQHSPVSESCNPSLPCLGQALAEGAGFIDVKLAGMFFYGVAGMLLVLGPLAATVVGLVRQERMPDDWSLMKRLDQLLIEKPQIALRLTALSMFALYMCAPRLKEYAYFELAIYAAALVSGLSAAGMAAIIIGAVLVPVLAMGSHDGFVSTYSQLLSALFCFWIFVLSLNPSTSDQRRLHSAGSLALPASS